MGETFQPACRRMEWLDPFYQKVWEHAFAAGIPISGTFELTPRCNFSCKMCYVHLRPEEIALHGRELSGKEWLHMAEQARDAGTVWLCVTGGEPLSHPDFPEIWKGLATMGFFLTLQTNASLVTGRMAELLDRYPPRQAKITLYGSNDGVYEAVCGVKDGFTRVNVGIHNLMSMGIPVELVSTLIRQNFDDVLLMADYARRHRLPWVATGGIRPSRRGTFTDIAAVQLTEQLKAHKRAEIAARIREKRFVDPTRKPCTYCRDYRLGYWILWNGQMRFCSFMDQPNLSAVDLPFQQAWRSLLDYEEGLDWPVECQNCEAAKVCTRCAEKVSGILQTVGESATPDCDFIRKTYKTFLDQTRKENGYGTGRCTGSL